MKINYAITVCDEFVEIQRLVNFLLKHKRHEDGIVILYDINNGDEGIEQFLRAKSVNCEIAWMPGEFDGHFANWKNKLTGMCDGDWIFQIDADEIPNAYLMEALPFILEANEGVEAFWVPRVNTVAGITDEHIAKWGWRVDDMGWVNFPDWQMRIYRNDNAIFWVKPVHEQLKGYTKFANLPPEEKFALYHPKNIGRQEKQNKFYETI